MYKVNMATQQKVHFSGDYEISQILPHERAVDVLTKNVKEDFIQKAVQTELEHNLRATSSNSTLSADNQPINKADQKLNQSKIIKQMQDLCNVLQHGSFVSDVKLLMFVAAANCDAYRSTLVPIPPIFMADTYYDIEKLRRTVATWPSCCQMLKALRSFDNQGQRLFRNLGADNISLLHWVLVSQSSPKIRRFRVGYLANICKKLHMERPTLLPTQMLRVRYRNEPRTVKSKRHHVYFGCPLNMLYRLLTMGDIDISWADSLRLYHKLEPALAQCDEMPTKCWPYSRFGRSPRCMTICELLESSAPIEEDFVIQNGNCLRVRYLLFFDESPEPNEVKSIAEDINNNNVFDDDVITFASCGLVSLGRRIFNRATQLVRVQRAKF